MSRARLDAPATGSRSLRRPYVDERIAVAVAIAAGFVAVATRPQPTGSAIADVVLAGLGVAFVTWTGASASWWAIASLAAVATAFASHGLLSTVIAAAAFAAALWIGLRRRDLALERAVVTGVVLNVVLASAPDASIGVVTVLMTASAMLVVVTGIRRRRRAMRRIGWWSMAIAGSFVLLAAGLLTATALGARESLQRGSDLARSGIDALDEGDYATAAERFDAAADRLAQSDRQLTGPWTQPARIVPILAQNRQAAADVSAEAASGLRRTSDALRSVDPDALRLVDGGVDLGAIGALEQPLSRTRAALDGLESTIASVDSPWIVSPLRESLDELAADLDENGERLDTALAAVRAAPGLLGGDGPRRYLVVFTTPSEARGLGGFPGNYAEITASAGRIELSGFGRIRDLERAIAAAGGRCTGCPEEFLARYGRFGFDSGPTGAVGSSSWRNITMPANFPDVAETMSVLYPQSGGRPIDGVIVADPYVVEQFVDYSGPIDLPAQGRVLDAGNVLAYILFEQYVGLTGDDLNDARIDALELIATDVIAGLLTSSLPAPPELARDLGPLISERRLLMWSRHADERDVLERLGLLGGLPALDGDAPAGLSVSVSNAGASKIDVFLQRDVEMTLVDERVASGAAAASDGDGARLVATVELTNGAPAAGLSDRLIGNAIGLPSGTSRLFVTFYGPPTLQSATLDGRPTSFEPLPEGGWIAYSQFVEIPPGETVTYELEFAVRGDAQLDLDDVVVWEQPLVRDPGDLRPRR